MAHSTAIIPCAVKVSQNGPAIEPSGKTIDVSTFHVPEVGIGLMGRVYNAHEIIIDTISNSQ